MNKKEILNTADYLLLANIVGSTVKDLEDNLDPNDEKSKEILEIMNELHSKLKRINSQNLPNVSDIIKKMNINK